MNLSLFRFTFFLFLAALFFSCTKITTTDIGSGLIPPVDGVNTKDTVLDVVTKNASYDTIAVGISDNHVLGFINDPNVFGKTTASVNFQIAPPSIPFSWGINKDNLILDSVVLCLSYKATWGDTNQAIKLHVYSMDPEVGFNNNSVYNNTVTFEKSQELTEFNTAKTIDIRTLNDIDTTDYNEVATSQIRIRLNNSFGQLLVNYDSSTVYQSDSTFYNALRGLIVEPEETGNGLMVVSLTDTSTHLSVYYRSSIETDSAKYNRKFSPNILTSASSNTILRNYQGTQIPAYISSTDTNQDLIFMQTSPGIYATIKTPGIDNLSNRIVHRAELLMYQVPDLANENDKFTPPNLFLAAYSSDSMRRLAIPNDITFSNNSISNLLQFGVAAKSNTGGQTVYYSFDITRYVQGLITRKEKKYDLVLFAPYNQYIFPAETFGTGTPFVIPISTPSLNIAGAGRVRLGGGTNNQYKMRLHIVYSLVQ